jgi:hypothetical protein
MYLSGVSAQLLPVILMRCSGAGMLSKSYSQFLLKV